MSRFQKGSDGHLGKNDLIMNKHRRIVSKKKHATAKKEKRLIKAGYGTKKGKFGLVLLRENKSKSRSRKQKGGVGGYPPFTSAEAQDREQKRLEKISAERDKADAARAAAARAAAAAKGSSTPRP